MAVFTNNRHAFRFPRPTIVFMLLGFVGTVLAIEMGRTISMGGTPDSTLIYSVLPKVLALLAVPFVAMAIGYILARIKFW